MTEEAGAVTGELEVSTRTFEDRLEVSVRYVGAREWYAVKGSPAPLDGSENQDPENLRRRVVERLTTPGTVVDGNERPVALQGRSLA